MEALRKSLDRVSAGKKQPVKAAIAKPAIVKPLKLAAGKKRAAR